MFCAGAAVDPAVSPDLKDGLRQLIQEEAVVGHHQNGSRESLQVVLQNGEGHHVQVISRPVQVNGKLKGTITMPADSEEKAVVDAALAVEKVQKATEGMKIVKTILVKNRLVNLIVKPQ